jgi:asparagine synthase (glutamine-hydrolysing)
LTLGPEARSDPLVDPEQVCKALALHRAGRYDLGKELWSLLTLEVWARIFLDGREPASLSLSSESARSDR